MRAALEPIFAEAIADRVTPGGALAVLDGGQVVAKESFGHLEAGDDAAPVTPETIFDVASLTKAIVTSTVLMRLVATGKITLDTRLADLLPRFADRPLVTVEQLAGHAAGFPAHVKFYERIWSGERAGESSAREAVLAMISATEPAYPAGERTIYSDLGYITLGRVLEAAGGARLDDLFLQLVAEPLEMRASTFVDTESGAGIEREGAVAPTELCPRRGRLRGEVHDENAHAAGGICGHAGLFSTVGDVLICARELCRAAGGGGGLFDGATVRSFWSRSAAPETTWHLGWDSPSGTPGVTHAGDRWPTHGVGHLGFTGCAVWIDPPKQRAVTILTNRVYYSRDKDGIKSLRRRLMDAIVSELDD